MKKISMYFLPVGLAFVATSLSAAVVQCTGTGGSALTLPIVLTTAASTYSPTGFGGPSIVCGPMTFSNWQEIAAGGNALNAALNLISPSTFDTTTGTAVLALNPNFVVPPDDSHLFFTVTSTTPIVSVDLGVGGMFSGIVERICTGAINAADGTCVGGLSAQLGSLSAQSGSSSVVTLSTPSTSFTVFKDIGTTAPGGQLTSFSESASTPIPEPVSMALLGGGLALLGFARWRRSGRKA
jgi:hypothetical protein